MPARLEVEIDGVNTGLKKALKDSLSNLTAFNKAINFKPSGSINASLSTTKQLLKDITGLAGAARNSLGGAANATAIQQQRVALAAARTETQNYRTESARLASELAALRLQTAQNRAATTAASGSYREAQQRLTALGKSIREAQNGFRSTNPIIQAQIREYRTLNRQLQDFDSTMGNNQRRVGNYQRAFAGIGGFIAGAFGFTALLAGGRELIRNNAEISDSLADVRRTAGLTATEATNLGASLKNVDTRTSLKDLLAISKIGGQLGIAKNQLAGFTKAVDQLSVALGDELKGGAEGIAKSLGVLDNVFKISANNGGNVEKAYNQIGSSILQLGQSGLATGDFLADFGERVGGIAKQAGLSLPTVLSFGAVLQENGVSAEVAGTAFKRLISAISSNSGKFFDVARMADTNLTLKEFNRIINTDTKKALELFFNGLNKGGSSTVAFNSILKSLKISGAGVSQVVSALASNIPALNKHIDESTKALNDGTIASDQFAIKNNTLAASIDKLGNAMTNITTSPDSNLGKFFKGIVDSFTGGIKVIDILTGKIGGLFEKLREVEDKRLIADNKGNVIPLGKSAQAELDAAIQREKARQKAINDTVKAEKKSNALKAGANLTRDAVLDIQAESNAKNLLTKTNERLALEEGKLAKIRLAYSKATPSTKGRDDLGQQLIMQRELVRLLKLEATSLKPRSTAESPITGGGKDKKGFSLADTLEKLRKALELTEVQFQATFEEKNNGKIAAYQAAINTVTDALGRQSKVVKDLQKQQKGLFQFPESSTNAFDAAKKVLDAGVKKLSVRGEISVPKLDKEEGKLAQRAARNLDNELNRAVSDFGNSFYRTLSNINQQADRSFTAIAGSFGESIGGILQDVFSNQLSKTLNDLVDGVKVTTEKAIVGFAGIAGGFISGITNKTSSVGQGAGGLLTGAAAGFSLGGVPGAIVGGLVGAIGGLFGANKARKEQEELQKQQLEEAKKQTDLLRQNPLAYTSAITGRMTNQGIITGVDIGSQGQLIAQVNGKQLDFILSRTKNSRG